MKNKDTNDAPVDAPVVHVCIEATVLVGQPGIKPLPKDLDRNFMRKFVAQYLKRLRSQKQKPTNPPSSKL